MKRQYGFSLVELLVVIAILSVLASLLLPTLATAIEESRRSSCSNSLHQIYIGAMMYDNTNNGMVPSYGPSDGSLATEEFEYNSGSGAVNQTSWRIYHLTGCISNTLFECPSQGWKPVLTANGQGIHYGFRYNSTRVISYSGGPTLKRNCLIDPKRAKMLLFTDASRTRRDDSYNIVSTNTGNYYRRKWAHQDGGNIVFHGGAVRWLPNVYSRWPANWYGGTLWTTWDGYVK